MKRKLTRASIDELRKEMPILSIEENRSVIGGGVVSGIKISGGYLISYDYSDVGGGVYTAFQPDNGGQTIIFDGVLCSEKNVASGSAYQLNGTIHIAEDWSNSGFTIYDFTHEYGHYLQQEQYGTATYIVDIAVPSTYHAATDPENHYQQWYEQDATKRGNEYLNKYGNGY